MLCKTDGASRGPALTRFIICFLCWGMLYGCGIDGRNLLLASDSGVAESGGSTAGADGSSGMTGAPAFQLDPTSEDFGLTTLDQSGGTQTFTVTNSGSRETGTLQASIG